MRHSMLVYGFVCLMASCDAATVETPVRPGIDVLLTDSIHLVRDVRVGLVTNHAGVDQNGVDDVTRLLESGVQLTTLFSPEHGFRGVFDQELIDHGTDSATGLPIYSLYGEVRAPTPTMLDAVDVLLIDLQDIGARTYTYVSTAILAMEVAHGVGIPTIVLDRPNPIGGELVQGPVLELQFTSFVGMLPVPLRHGMTLGELVLFANATRHTGADVTVVPADGWRRSAWLDQTGLPWIPPSPNMPSLESATHYPGLVLFEATNLSVGRGTAVAFQVVGAPWLKPQGVIDLLEVHPGVTVSDTVITPRAPTDAKYDGIPVPAVRLLVRDRQAYDPVRLAADLLTVIRRFHPDSLTVGEAAIDRRAGTDALRLDGWTGQTGAGWDQQIADFLRRREPFLLY